MRKKPCLVFSLLRLTSPGTIDIVDGAKVKSSLETHSRGTHKLVSYKVTLSVIIRVGGEFLQIITLQTTPHS